MVSGWNERIAVKRALITGITGQDGSYLAEFFVAKGSEVDSDQPATLGTGEEICISDLAPLIAAEVSFVLKGDR
jgi:GDP-mannose 4,6 dehydratase